MEESILVDCNSPFLYEQKTAHEAFEEKLTSILIAASMGTADRRGLYDFVRIWVADHVLGCDLQYAESIAEHVGSSG